MEFFSEYLRHNSLVSKVDGRIKLAVALFIILLTISYKGIIFPIVILVVSGVFFYHLKLPPKVIAIRYSEPLFIVVVLFLIKSLSVGSSALFYMDLYLFELTVYQDGIYEGMVLALRILSAVSVVVLLGFLMPFTEFIAALSWFKAPKTFVEVMVFAYRYIFVLLEEALVIYNAQKNRLGYSSIRRGLNSFGILSGSLTLRAFDHSQNTAIAMVQRGFDGDIPILKQRPLRTKEVCLALMFMGILTVLWKI